MRKQINRDLFEEIKRNYTKYFNFEEDTFIDRQQALEIANIRLRDLQIEVRRVFTLIFLIRILDLTFLKSIDTN